MKYNPVDCTPDYCAAGMCISYHFFIPCSYLRIMEVYLVKMLT